MTTPVHRFRMAVVKVLGQRLTPEVAAAIEAQAFALPDLSVDPGRFAPQAHGDYRIQVESFAEILQELEPLHREHWLETEKFRHGLQFNPDYDLLAARERAGHLVQFTVRCGGQLAGQLMMCIGQSIYTSTKTAEEVTLFLRANHRPNGHLMTALLRYAERVMVELGAREISVSSKVVNHADALMRRLRYPHVGNQFVKVFPADPPTEVPPERAACAQS